jgi:hypothetical protein
MTIVVGDKDENPLDTPFTEEDRRRLRAMEKRVVRRKRLLQSLWWLAGIVLFALLKATNTNPMLWNFLQAACWIGVAVSLVRAARA